MDRRVEVTSADGCAVRIRVPARHQSKGGKRCQAKHQADQKARSGSNGRSHPPASARFGEIVIDREAGCLRAKCAWKAKDPSQLVPEPAGYVKGA